MNAVTEVLKGGKLFADTYKIFADKKANPAIPEIFKQDGETERKCLECISQIQKDPNMTAEEKKQNSKVYENLVNQKQERKDRFLENDQKNNESNNKIAIYTVGAVGIILLGKYCRPKNKK